jgi:hypothetical protein
LFKGTPRAVPDREILKCLGEIWRTGQKFLLTLEGKGVFKGF